jgi:ADP-heptose:LPS heptosyltransferase
MWEWYVRELGVEGIPDFSPVITDPPVGVDGPIGLIAGSENFPAKRWPVDRWRELILNSPERRFVLFGTETDRGITQRIAAGMGDGRVLNLAGRTNMDDYMRELVKCSLVISNDTGGMHLANALGVPVVGLFGPTNPLRTGPVFSGSVRIVQPAGCPPMGGGDLSSVLPRNLSFLHHTGKV